MNLQLHPRLVETPPGLNSIRLLKEIMIEVNLLKRYLVKCSLKKNICLFCYFNKTKAWLVAMSYNLTLVVTKKNHFSTKK